MLTDQHVKKALSAVDALGGQMKSLSELAAGATEALRQAPKGLTPAGAAAFLATMAQESAWFRTTEEYNKKGRYAPYIGRTFEQITWKDNYRKFGLWAWKRGLLADPDEFVQQPKQLADYRWAWLGGVWYFEENGLWSYANRGDFLAVQRAVNLGNPHTSKTPAGYTIRKKAFDAFLSVGSELLPDVVIEVPTTTNVGVWIVNPLEVSSVLLGRRGLELDNPLSPGTTIADGIRFEKNVKDRYALLRSDGWSYDREYLLQIGPVHTGKRPFPVIPDYDQEEKIPFRGMLVCRCVAISIPWIEYRMLEEGLIKFNLDFYQGGYNGTRVKASALTHARGMMIDTGQYSDAQLRVWREMGYEMQHRTIAQGFSGHHGHGGPKGCTHGSNGTENNQGAIQQHEDWMRGRDGLLQHQRITGPGPKGPDTPDFDVALAAFIKQVTAA